MKRNKGFTLVELLVVIAIIALLVSILLPSLTKVREMAKRAMCMQNIKNIGNMLAVYTSVSRGSFPMALSDDWTTGTGEDRNVESAADVGHCVTSLLWLLVRTQQGVIITTDNSGPRPETTNPDVKVTELFRCPSDGDSEKLVDYEPHENWDFEKPENVSYSYQNPTAGKLRDFYSLEVILADKTPIYDEMELSDWTDPTLTEAEKRACMSQNHGGEQINYLLLDATAQSKNRPNVSEVRDFVERDVIYTTFKADPATAESSIITEETDHGDPRDSFLIGPYRKKPDSQAGG